MIRSDVPCGSCRACCGGDLIMLMPEEGDDIASYDHEIIEVGSSHNRDLAMRVAAVKKGADGNCVYLGADGCTIHDRAPAICQRFDCRKFFLSRTRNERRAMIKSGIAAGDVIRAGRERLGTL